MKELSESERTLFGYVRSAASLRLDLLPLEEDEKHSDTLKKIFYAVDTNIVHFWRAPYKVGPQRPDGSGGGFSVVFEDDPIIVSSALASALATYIFWRLTGQSMPLLLLFGHDAEVRGTYDAALREADSAREKIKEDRNNIKAFLERAATIENFDEKIRYIENESSELMNYLFYEEGPGHELNRFNQLLSYKRLSRLSSLAEEKAFFEEFGEDAEDLAKAFRGPLEVRDLFEESIYRRKWSEALQSGKHASSKTNMRLDASALARLEFVNRRLSRKGYKIALITGDRAIMRIADNIESHTGPGRSFAREFIRHPRAFLATSEVLKPHTDEDDRVVETRQVVSSWLDTFLARFDANGEVESLRQIAASRADSETAAGLVDRIRSALKADPECLSRIRKEWNSYTEALVEAHSASSTLAREQIRHVFGRSIDSSIDQMLRQIDVRLTDERNKEWSELEEALMRVGLELLPWDEGGIRRSDGRNPPPISFDRFHAAREFVRWASMPGNLEKAGAESVKIKISKIDQEDDTGYARLLAFAWLFGFAGRWRAASVVASRAVEIAEEVRSELAEKALLMNPEAIERRTRISGREALYLQAVALRYQAEDARDLRKSASALIRARECLEYDRDVDNGLSIRDTRFDAEALALDLTWHLFWYFGDTSDDAPIKQLEDVAWEISRLIETLGQETDHWISESLKRRLHTNFYMAVALLELEEKLDGIEGLEVAAKGHVVGFLECSETASEDRKFPVTTLLCRVLDYAVARFGNMDRQKRREISRRLNEPPNNRSELIFYDSARYSALKRLTSRALNAD